MGWFNRRKDTELAAVQQVNQLVLSSFQKVRQDMFNVHEWLRYLYDQNLTQQKVIEDLKMQLQMMPKSKEEVRDLIDEYYDHEKILNRIQAMEQEVQELRKNPIQPIAPVYQQPVLQHRESSKPAHHLRDKIIRNVTRNSKEYIKNLILQAMNKYEKISGLQLREIFVEEQGVVSRSSFYRLLNEIENQADITVIQDGKEKVYITKIAPEMAKNQDQI